MNVRKEILPSIPNQFRKNMKSIFFSSIRAFINIIGLQNEIVMRVGLNLSRKTFHNFFSAKLKIIFPINYFDFIANVLTFNQREYV